MATSRDLKHDLGAEVLKALRAHRQLLRTMRKLELQVRPLLADLGRELAAHFAVEEAPGGYYEILRARFPQLAGRLDRLRRQHPGLLQAVNAPMREIKDMLAALRRHEAAENELLQTANNVEQGDASD